MAKAEILSQIKETETSAKEMVEEAIEAKNKKVSKARAEAREIIKQAEAEAEESADNSMRSAQKEIQSEREKIIDKGNEEAEALRSKARNNMDGAINYLLKEFERSVHA